MSEQDPPGALALDDEEMRQAEFVAELIRHRTRIPDTEFVRPCERIERDTREWEGVGTIASRFEALEDKLPLAGANALKPLRNGTLSIIAHLRAEAPWMAAAIDLLDEQFRANLWAGRPWVSFKPMLLVGPAGCGKSHLAKLIAERAATGYAALSMAGMSDATSIEGTPRGFNQTTPCFPALVMSQTRTANPIALLDELDKADHNPYHGDPKAAILTLIEPSTAKAYWDRCLLTHVDVSHVNWLFTANSAERLSGPLRSRLDIVEVEGPGEEQYDGLVRNVLRDLALRWRMPPSMLPDLEPTADDALRLRFARHRSARRLAREVQAALAATLTIVRRTIN